MSIIIPQNDGPNFDTTEFEGTSIYNVIGMYYLSHIEPNNICVINGEPYEPDEGVNVEKGHVHNKSCVKLPSDTIYNIPGQQTSVSLRWIEKENEKSYISVPKPHDKFWRNFGNCSGKRFVALPFGFNCLKYGHANYLLFDKKLKTLERFESFGKVKGACIGNVDIDSKIVELFRTNFEKYLPEMKEFKYYGPLDILPSNNVQTIQEEEERWRNRKEDNNPVGFCSVWSLWYIELRTLNPDVEHNELISLAIKGIRDIEAKREPKYGKGSFTDFIRRYSKRFVELQKKIVNNYNNNDGGCGCTANPWTYTDGGCGCTASSNPIPYYPDGGCGCKDGRRKKSAKRIKWSDGKRSKGKKRSTQKKRSDGRKQTKNRRSRSKR